MKRFISGILLMLSSATLVAQTNSGARDYTTAVLWQQRSGEYRALAFQAYNFARLSLAIKMQYVPQDKKNCVVVDVDETVLDNSPYQGYELKRDMSYNQADWVKWTSKGVADTVPGALGFLKYAATQQVETFYITNRGDEEYEGTLSNLKNLGFPYADREHLILKSSTSDKEPRRQKVSEKYNILLLCGDNLSDFSNVFYREGKNTLEQVNKAQQQFGTHYIVLPNPMYGDWEKQFYPEGKLSEQEKSVLRAKGLKSY